MYFYTVMCKSMTCLFDSIRVVTDGTCNLSISLLPAVRCMVILIETSHLLLGMFGSMPYTYGSHRTMRLSVDGKAGTEPSGVAVVMWVCVPNELMWW